MAATRTKKDRTGLRRGRPERDPLEIYRTTFWARAVYSAAKAPRHKLGRALGKDGRWIGLWARYDKGLVSPSRERIRRIDGKLPGTGRYYFCPIWGLLHQRSFTQDDLRTAVNWLNTPVRIAFLAEDEFANGPFWRKPGDKFELLGELIRSLGDRRHGLDALVAILIVLREAELCQDARLYLTAMRAWAQAANRLSEHSVLRHFPVELIESVLNPLGTIRFADTKADAAWEQHVAAYRKSKLNILHIDPAANVIDLARTFPLVNVSF